VGSTEAAQAVRETTGSRQILPRFGQSDLGQNQHSVDAGPGNLKTVACRLYQPLKDLTNVGVEWIYHFAPSPQIDDLFCYYSLLVQCT
jgi:hypothetical protein